MACKSDVAYNFGPIDPELDQLLYGSARPGAESQRCFDANNKVTPDEVRKWAEYVKGKGVTRVVALLTDSEIGTYQTPPVETLQEEGLKAVNINLEAGGQPMKKVAEQIREAEAAGEKVVVHCWGGGGRVGKVVAAYLASQHDLSVQEAAARVEGAAKQLGTSRRADPAATQQLVDQLKSPASSCM